MAQGHPGRFAFLTHKPSLRRCTAQCGVSEDVVDRRKFSASDGGTAGNGTRDCGIATENRTHADCNVPDRLAPVMAEYVLIQKRPARQAMLQRIPIKNFAGVARDVGGWA